MLWYKAWLDTRWRFLIGLCVLLFSAVSVVVSYPAVEKLMPLARSIQPGGGPLGRAISEAIEVERTYRGFVWYQWFSKNLAHIGTLVAIIIGSGGLLAQSSSALFTLSLPVSRARVLGVKAATGLAELVGVVVLPTLVIPLLSSTIGQRYGIGDAFVHAACAYVGIAVFFSLAFLLSTVFGDVWRPALIACFVAVVVGTCEYALLGDSRYGIFGAMSAVTWFQARAIPWPGLIVSAAAAAAMLYAASVTIARRDF